MEKSRSKNVNNSRVTHSVDPAVIEENAKKAPDGDALYREAFAKKLNELLEEKQIDQKTLAAKTKISETSGINNLESFVEKKRHDGFIEGIMNAQDNFKDRSSFTNIEHNTKK